MDRLIQEPTRPAPPVPVAGVQLLLKRLTENPNFDYYHRIIHNYLYASDEIWSTLLQARADPTGFFSNNHPSITQTPPQDIFEIISHIRNSANWRREKIEILNRVNSGKRKQPPHGSSNQPCLSARRPESTPSPSLLRRVSQLRTEPNVPSIDYTRPDNLSLHVDSTHRDTNSISVDGRKTAPDGYRFFCPSRNCKNSYTRQGDYDNHIDQRHAELAQHNPHNSLRKISQGVKGVITHQNESLASSATNNNANSPAPPFPAAPPISQYPTPTPRSSDAHHHQDVIPDLVHPVGGQGRSAPYDIEDPAHSAPQIDPSTYFFYRFGHDLDGQTMFPNQSISASMPQGPAYYDDDISMGWDDDVQI